MLVVKNNSVQKCVEVAIFVQFLQFCTVQYFAIAILLQYFAKSLENNFSTLQYFAILALCNSVQKCVEVCRSCNICVVFIVLHGAIVCNSLKFYYRRRSKSNFFGTTVECAQFLVEIQSQIHVTPPQISFYRLVGGLR